MQYGFLVKRTYKRGDIYEKRSQYQSKETFSGR